MPFSDMTTALGQTIPVFLLDGDIKRFKDNKGKSPFWGIGREWEFKGNTYKYVKFGDWRDSSIHTWTNYDTRKQTKQFIKKQAAIISEIAAMQKYESDKKNKACVEKWTPIFNSAPSTSELHPYLKEKNINSNHVAKVGATGALLIPGYDQLGFVGLQQIFKSEVEQSFVKRFSSGIKLKGSFCPIGEIKNAKYIYVAEGYATACTVFELTNVPTVCCWNCGNMLAAINSIRSINPRCRIIIAADNDKNGIGLKKASRAKNTLSNIVVKCAKFENYDEKYTDFNDLSIIESPDVASFQLSFSDADFIEISTLGHDGKKYFYFNSQSLELKSFTAVEHSSLNLLSMAGQKFWGDKYRFKTGRDGEVTNKADFDYVAEKLFEEQRQRGYFNYQNVRGYGTWIDDGRIVVNLGDRQLVDGKTLEDFDTKYLYTSNYPLTVDLENPLTDLECKDIIDLFKSLNYKNKGDYVYICSFVAMAQIFGAIDWRPQIWLTGAAGSGKTEIMKMISKLVFDSEIYQSITAASIRQHLQSNAMPMVVDEAEPNSAEARKRMDEIIELIRQCSSRMNTKTMRGTASGQAQEFNVNSIFCLASIQTFLPTKADITRFFVVDMNTNESSTSDQWNKIVNKFNKVENYTSRLFSRMIKLAPIVRENIKTMRELLQDSAMLNSPRQCDQVSTSIACYFALESSQLISDKDMPRLLQIAQELNLGDSEYENDNTLDESEVCLDTVLQIGIRGTSKTIEMNIETLRKKPSLYILEEELAFFGIRFFPKENEIFLSANNFQLKKELSHTMYHDYSKVLKRHSGVRSRTTCRLSGKVVKGVTVRL